MTRRRGLTITVVVSATVIFGFPWVLLWTGPIGTGTALLLAICLGLATAGITYWVLPDDE